MRSFILCIGLVSIQQNQLFAQTSITLEQALNAALQNSYAIQVANKNIEIAANNNNYGEAGRYPTVNFNLASNNTYSNINNPTSFLNGASLVNGGLTPSVDATWVLFDGNKVRINKNRLELLEKQQIGNSKIFIENTIQQVTKNYFNALVQQKRLKMQGELLALSRDKIRYIEARREFGQALEFDRLQINDAYLNDSIQWVVQLNNYQLSLQNLALAMNVAPDSMNVAFTLADTLDYNLPIYTNEELKNKLLSTNQTLANLKTAEYLSNIQLDLQKSNRYPRITVGSGLSEQITVAKIDGKQPAVPNTWRGGATFSGYINFSLTYTIYNGGKITRAIQNAEMQREITKLQINDQQRILLQQLQINLTRYNNQIQVIALTNQLVENAKKNLAIAEEKFKSNTLNFFDLRTIQINYLRSVNALQDAFLNAKNIEIDILLAVGEYLK